MEEMSMTEGWVS